MPHVHAAHRSPLARILCSGCNDRVRQAAQRHVRVRGVFLLRLAAAPGAGDARLCALGAQDATLVQLPELDHAIQSQSKAHLT